MPSRSVLDRTRPCAGRAPPGNRTGSDRRTHPYARRVHRHRARGAAEDPGDPERLCRGALSRQPSAVSASAPTLGLGVGDAELQRQLISLAVKEAYTNILFAGRLIRVQEQAVQRAELNLRSAKGFFEV